MVHNWGVGWVAKEIRWNKGILVEAESTAGNTPRKIIEPNGESIITLQLFIIETISHTTLANPAWGSPLRTVYPRLDGLPIWVLYSRVIKFMPKTPG